MIKMDPVNSVVYTGGIALVVLLASAVYVVWQNGGSRNLALGLGALGGAAVIFATQVYFELNQFSASSEHDGISTDITLDRATPQIRQWVYPNVTTQNFPSFGRISVEVGASNWLAANAPARFNDDAGQLSTDLITHSLAAFLGIVEFDWQVRRTVYAGGSAGALLTAERVSNESDCTVVTKEQIVSLLSCSQNLFAGAPLPEFQICLPPGSKLEISRNSLTIKNRICQLSFRVSSPPSESYVRPGSGGAAPQLPNGKPQFTTRWIGIDVETRFFPWRIQSRDSGRYRDWAARVVTDAREWFK